MSCDVYYFLLLLLPKVLCSLHKHWVKASAVFVYQFICYNCHWDVKCLLWSSCITIHSTLWMEWSCVYSSLPFKTTTQTELGVKKLTMSETWISGAHQTVQLGHRALAARLADVPDFDTAFATSVDMTCGVANGNSAHHLAVAQRVDLTGVAWNTGADQSVGRKGNRLHLTVCTDVEGVSPDVKDMC